MAQESMESPVLRTGEKYASRTEKRTAWTSSPFPEGRFTKRFPDHRPRTMAPCLVGGEGSRPREARRRQEGWGATLAPKGPGLGAREKGAAKSSHRAAPRGGWSGVSRRRPPWQTALTRAPPRRSAPQERQGSPLPGRTPCLPSLRLRPPRLPPVPSWSCPWRVFPGRTPRAVASPSLCSESCAIACAW